MYGMYGMYGMYERSYGEQHAGGPRIWIYKGHDACEFTGISCLDRRILRKHPKEFDSSCRWPIRVVDHRPKARGIQVAPGRLELQRSLMTSLELGRSSLGRLL